MAESADSLFRRGLISSKAAKKLPPSAGGHPKILNETKHQKSKMAKFDDKGGARDQGGVRDAGERSVASSRHINQKQDMGTPARASGKPSKGGSVNKYGQPGAREIDESRSQKPDFPRGSKVSGSNKGRAGSRTVAKVPPSGGMYGGGGQDTW